MNLERLRSFTALVEAGGFRRAAAQLNLSQSALSRQIGVLEAELGATLIRRGRPPLALTEAGQFVAQQAGRLLAEAEFMRQEARRLGGGRDPTLSVGVLQSLLEGVFATALLNWRRAWPGVPLRVVGFRSAPIIAEVAAGRLHAGLVAMQPSDPLLSWRKVMEDAFVAVLPPGHPLADSPPGMAVDMAALAQEGLVLPPRGFDLRHAVDLSFAAMGVTPRINAELEGIGAIRSLVRSGLGPSILPASAVSRFSDQVRPLSGNVPRRVLGVVWQAARRPDAAMAALIADIEMAARESRDLSRAPARPPSPERG